jgi:hypothetical protein
MLEIFLQLRWSRGRITWYMGRKWHEITRIKEKLYNFVKVKCRARCIFWMTGLAKSQTAKTRS